MIAPEPQLTALLEVIYRASLRARDLGYGGKTLPEERRGPALLEVSDLMDAIHNIPLYLTTYEDWDEQHFRSAFLAGYDQKWSATSGLKLSVVYEDALSGMRSSVESTRAHFREHRKSGGA
jgi:hypothetical protein